QLERLQKLLEERELTLELTDAAKRYLAERGYDPVFGARPLKRAIQRELQDPLAMAILEGGAKPGDHIIADLGEGGIVFSVVAGERNEHVMA
ncbi:MAG: type VI secretion system ATPase TssH, partial [Chloroflexi bacterium]